jgi:hypothetical protein
MQHEVLRTTPSVVSVRRTLNELVVCSTDQREERKHEAQRARSADGD